MTSTGSRLSGPTISGGPPTQRVDQVDDVARLRDLDDVVQCVFAAGMSLRMATELSTQPGVVGRLEQIASDLDAIVRRVWRTSLSRDVPLRPTSDSTIAVPALARGTRSKRPANPESG